MADFDTVSKRFSGMQLGEVPDTILPNPDGTLTQGDRQHLLSLYSGIAAANPGGGTAKPWLYYRQMAGLMGA